MLSMHRLKEMIMFAIIISFLATFLNEMKILQFPIGASTVLNIGTIMGLVFAIIAIRLVLLVPEKYPE